MHIYSYNRASTDKQDASRAISGLNDFVRARNKRIAHHYVENVSGTATERPELDKLIAQSQPGDVLLVEKIDRLTRLPYPKWQEMKGRLRDAGLIIVVVDLPVTHTAMDGSPSDINDLTGIIMRELTNLMIEMAAGMARDDWETRSKRTAQGIAKAKALGKYKGREPDKDKHRRIAELLAKSDLTMQGIADTVGVSLSTVKRVKRQSAL